MRKLPNLDILLRSMNGRYSSNPIYKVCSIAFPFQRRGPDNRIRMTLPIYDPGIPVFEAWDQFISIIASAIIHPMDTHLPMWGDELMRASHPPTIQLLRLFPHPSRHHWFPSWAQVQQYPDVSVRDNDPGHAVISSIKSDSLPWHRWYGWLRDYITKKKDPGPIMIGGMDHCLHIVSGRIYRSCSLQLTQSPTPEKRAIYSCTMGNQGAQLVATVPSIELPINSETKYVLVDISPDNSLWHNFHRDSCRKVEVGHEHQPIWQESVVLVCEEVDTLPQPTAKDSLKMKYYLRRITTLEWDCRLSTESGPGRWLPFQPSLVHRRSTVCSTWGAKFKDTLDLGMFCEPAALLSQEDTFIEWIERTLFGDPAALLSQEDTFTEWIERTPMYSVYLV